MVEVVWVLNLARPVNFPFTDFDRSGVRVTVSSVRPGAGSGMKVFVSERVRWQLRSLMHHNECCNAENSKV